MSMVYGIPTVSTRGHGVANPYSAKFHYNFVSPQITLSGSTTRLESCICYCIIQYDASHTV